MHRALRWIRYIIEFFPFAISELYEAVAGIMPRYLSDIRIQYHQRKAMIRYNMQKSRGPFTVWFDEKGKQVIKYESDT